MTPSTIKKILLIELRGIGDVVMTTPLIRVLHRNFPDASIDVMVKDISQSLLAHHPLVRHSIGFDRPYFKRHRDAWLRFMLALRRERYDMVINLYPIERNALMAWWTGAQWRGGFRGKWWFCHRVLTHPVEDRQDIHAIDALLSTLAPMGITDFTHQGLELYPGPDDVTRVEELWRETGLPDDMPVIGIHNGSNFPIKHWTESNLVEVLEALQARGMCPVMLGGPEEMEMSARVASRLAHPIPMLTGRLQLLQLAAFLRKCTMLVTCDSGPMHIAASQGVPCVGLFGPTDERRYGPYGDGHLIIRSSYACEHFPHRLGPCRLPDCPQIAPCMSSITPDQVIGAVMAQIERQHHDCARSTVHDFARREVHDFARREVLDCARRTVHDSAQGDILDSARCEVLDSTQGAVLDKAWSEKAATR